MVELQNKQDGKITEVFFNKLGICLSMQFLEERQFLRAGQIPSCRHMDTWKKRQKKVLFLYNPKVTFL